MKSEEKYLYHQIHPAKLATDWIAAAISLFFFWNHALVWGLAILFIPSIVASFYLMRYADLSHLKHSAFGKYVAKHMTRPVEFVRFFGMFIAVAGAWHQSITTISIGVSLILLAWLRGKLSA
jgi:hypothetical protein